MFQGTLPSNQQPCMNEWDGKLED